jgi:hypothetical protein
MEKQFLDETGLQKVAENINSRLKTVTIMPVNPKDGQVVLYVGESGMAYTKGCIYQFDESEDEWMDITPILTVDGAYNPQSENAQSGVALSQAQTVLMNKLFKMNTWESRTWYGLTSFTGNPIWTDGTDVYYSAGSDQYILNRATSTWESKTWEGMSSFYGSAVWSDGTDIYCSNSSTQKILNKTTGEWETKTWNGSLRPNSGSRVWTDGTNFYYSKDTTQYVLNKATDTWETKTWNGLNNFVGENVWSDGTDIYYSNGTYAQYRLNKLTDTWETMYWSTIYIGNYIWSDGSNTYYSNGSDQYVFDRETLDWKSVAWEGYSQISGEYIWFDGTHIYYSNNDEQYELAKILRTYIK